MSNERKEIIRKGMHAMLEDRLERVTNFLNDHIKTMKEKYYSALNEDHFNSKKDESKKSLMNGGNINYSPFAEIASNYIEVQEYNERYQAIMEEKMKEINEWEYQK